MGSKNMKFKRVLFNKRLLFFIIIIMLLSLILSSVSVSAHSPSNMNLSYNMTIEELGVSIAHQVPNPNSHYVYNIVIKINGVTNISQSYTSQPGSSFTYTYNIKALEGDTFEATALCNQGGSISKQLTVSSGEVSKTDDDDSSTPGFELILFMIALIVLMIVIRKKR
jgi:hypothetical protein